MEVRLLPSALVTRLMNKSAQKKQNQLGMPIGTASAKLRKAILFRYVQKCGDDICFQCQKPITDIEDFSIEHKQPYLNAEDPVSLFFDLDNIAFSHLGCNIKASRVREPSHGNPSTYNKGCRCQECKIANTIRRRAQRLKKKQTNMIPYGMKKRNSTLHPHNECSICSAHPVPKGTARMAIKEEILVASEEIGIEHLVWEPYWDAVEKVFPYVCGCEYDVSPTVPHVQQITI